MIALSDYYKYNKQKYSNKWYLSIYENNFEETPVN